MGNTYDEILVESEQRWVAERANIMRAIERQRPTRVNDQERNKFAIPLQIRHGRESLYLQLEVNDMDRWKKSISHTEQAGSSKVWSRNA